MTSPLIWLGGKERLLPKIKPFFPQKFNTFYDPFCGGGSVSLSMLANGHHVVIGDQNFTLINFWKQLKRNPRSLNTHFSEYIQKHTKTYFNSIKNEYPSQNLTQLAAHFLYLNRASFGGIYRENTFGGLNIQVRTSKINWVSLMDLLQCSQWLQGAIMFNQDFEHTCKMSQPGDLVYFDPPYLEFNSGDKRSVYQANGFDYKQQVRLAQTWHSLTARGVYCVQSNSYSSELLTLYPQANFYELPITYKVTGQSVKANYTKEYLFTNYDMVGVIR
jgi:DNA adenine methylase